MGQQTVLHIRFDLSPGHDPELLERLRRLLEDFTPRVQMLEPDSAVLDLTGSLRFWRRNAHGITELIQLRTLALYGVRSGAGAAPNRSRQVRGFLRAQGSELAGHLTLRHRSSSRLRQQAFVRPALGRV